jgi:prolyl-tRNA synthetase
MTELRLLAAADLALAAPPPRPEQALPWRPGETVEALVDGCGQDVGWATLGRFSSWLRDAGVLDTRAIDLPGAVVTLPYGRALERRFEAIVRRQYEAWGYEEYDYPSLVPASALVPSGDLLPLKNMLLFAGDDEDWASGRRRAVLTPTGEAAVYSHWARSLRHAGQLPIRMYRRARYYRPAAAGPSVFRAMESSDVYEFHACHADRAGSAAGMRASVDMLRRVCQELHVPVLWSTRPPWTNRAAVAATTVGADVPLPHGATLQVSSVYDQQDRFAAPYNVRFRMGGAWVTTQHVAGYVSRRLLLAHLFLGMDTDGELLVHPGIAPVQVGVTLAGGDGGDHATAAVLIRALAALGVRARLEAPADRRSVGRLHRRWRRQGLPLRLYLQPARGDDRPARAVVVRADTREEAVVPLDDVTGLAARIPAALAEVGAGYAHRAYGFAARQCVSAGAGEVRDVLSRRGVAVCPLAPAEEVVRAVGAWRTGEVLGFVRDGRAGVCAVSGRPTDAVAYLSPRT